MASWISWGCSSGSEYLTESPVNIVPPIHRKTAHNSVHTTQYWYYCSRNLCTKKYRDISQSLKHASFIQRSNPSNAVILVGFIDRPMSSTLARSQRYVNEPGQDQSHCYRHQHTTTNGRSCNHSQPWLRRSKQCSKSMICCRSMKIMTTSASRSTFISRRCITFVATFRRTS